MDEALVLTQLAINGIAVGSIIALAAVGLNPDLWHFALGQLCPWGLYDRRGLSQLVY